MSTAIARALSQIATESGEVTADATEFHEDLNELLLAEAQVSKEPTITDQVEEASKAGDVTEQLDELAVRADEVAGIDNPAVLEVAVESLHREFRCIMRANNLPFNASSFESTMVTANQAKGLAADARRVAGFSRQVSSDIIGYSEEAGSIVKFIRRDSKRLADAQAVLSKAIPSVQRISEQLKENPVVISHSGSARFLTVAGMPATDFKEAMAAEVAQMHKLHDAITQAIAAVQEGAHAFASNPQAPIEQLLPASKFAALNAFGDKHHFLGNHTIVAKPDKSSPVHDFRRMAEDKMQGWNAAKSVAWVPMAGLGWAFTAGFILAIGGAVTGGALTTAYAASAVAGKMVGYGVAGAAIKSGIDNYHNNANHSETKSAASAFDFLKSLTELSAIGRMAEFKFNEDAVFNSLDATHKAGAPNATYGAFEDTIGNIAAAIDCLYEQAIYDVVEGSKLAAQVTRNF